MLPCSGTVLSRSLRSPGLRVCPFLPPFWLESGQSPRLASGPFCLARLPTLRPIAGAGRIPTQFHAASSQSHTQPWPGAAVSTSEPEEGGGRVVTLKRNGALCPEKGEMLAARPTPPTLATGAKLSACLVSPSPPLQVASTLISAPHPSKS